KKGKSGKTTVEVSLSSGMGSVANEVELLNTVQYITMRREALVNDERDPRANDYDINGSWDESRYTNWQKELIGGTAYFSNTQLSISGGNSQTQFLVGGAHHKETTVYPGDHSFARTS